MLDNLSHEASETIVLLGGFNIDLLNFDTSEHVTTFLYDLASNSLQPQILLPTSVSNNSKTLIDNFFCKAGLRKLFVCRHPTLDLREGSVGLDFFYFGEGQSRSRGFNTF